MINYDTFAPMGPWIVTDIDPHHLVSFISHIMTLLPGDVIATGTSLGIGQMAIGDKVDIVIEGIGTLSNVVVAEE